MTKTLIIAEKPSVALDISRALGGFTREGDYYESDEYVLAASIGHLLGLVAPNDPVRSEEHTSELQSRGHLVCRLLLDEKNLRPCLRPIDFGIVAALVLLRPR